jgi:hypothetical protein
LAEIAAKAKVMIVSRNRLIVSFVFGFMLDLNLKRKFLLVYYLADVCAELRKGV